MVVAVIAAALALLAGAGLWIRWLYGQRDRVPGLVAALKATADRRDEHAAALALARRERDEFEQHAKALARTVADLGAQLRRITDARIQAAPTDAAAQLALTNELLSRPWPGGSSAGADGDRQGASASAVPTADSAGSASAIDRPH